MSRKREGSSVARMSQMRFPDRASLSQHKSLQTLPPSRVAITNPMYQACQGEGACTMHMAARQISCTMHMAYGVCMKFVPVPFVPTHDAIAMAMESQTDRRVQSILSLQKTLAAIARPQKQAKRIKQSPLSRASSQFAHALITDRRRGLTIYPHHDDIHQSRTAYHPLLNYCHSPLQQLRKPALGRFR